MENKDMDELDEIAGFNFAEGWIIDHPRCQCAVVAVSTPPGDSWLDNVSRANVDAAMDDFERQMAN